MSVQRHCLLCDETMTHNKQQNNKNIIFSEIFVANLLKENF